MSALVLFVLGLGLAALLMATVFLGALRIRNFSIVDIAWSAVFTPLVLLYAALADGYGPRRALIAAMVARVAPGSGATPATRTTSSNGSSGWPTPPSPGPLLGGGSRSAVRWSCSSSCSASPASADEASRPPGRGPE